MTSYFVYFVLQCRWSSSVESKMIQDDAYITVLEMKWK